MRSLLITAVGVIVLVAITAFMPPLPDDVGQIDWRAYWGASYLLGQGLPFADHDTLLDVQHRLTNWYHPSSAQMTWNPPWLLALLLPLTWFSFAQATWIWLFLNLILLIGCSHMMWQLEPDLNPRSWLWFAISGMIFFPAVRMLVFGQISGLLLLGLVGFLYFSFCKDRPLTAGALLALTTIKPHVVFLALPLILLDALWRRQWRIWIGFAGVLLILTAVVFGLRPSFISEYVQTTAGSDIGRLTVPTLSAYLAFLVDRPTWRFASLLMGPIMLGVWWFNWRLRPEGDRPIWICQALLLSVITAPYGFTFDFVVLLVPIWMVGSWMAARQISRAAAIAIVALLVLANGAIFWQQLQDWLNIYFFWFPILIGIVYSWSLNLKQSPIPN